MKEKLLTLTFILSCFVLSFGQEIIFRQPSNYVQRYICHDSIKFLSVNYNSFRIYFKENSYIAENLSEVKQDLDLAFSRIQAVLDIERYNMGIYLVAVDSKEEMEELMGYKIKGGAAHGHDLVFFVYNENIRPQFKHEIFHLIAYEVWGATNSRLLNEGGATYTDNYCFYDNPMYTINSYYLQEKMLFPLDSLIYNFNEQARKNDVLAYIQSAGIFKYLYEKYGVKKIKQLWTEGFENFDSIYSFSWKQLETDWLDFLETIPIPEDFDINKLKDGCG